MFQRRLKINEVLYFAVRSKDHFAKKLERDPADGRSMQLHQYYTERAELHHKSGCHERSEIISWTRIEYVIVYTCIYCKASRRDIITTF